MQRRRSRFEVLCRALKEGAAVGAIAGAVVGVLLITVSLLTDPTPSTISKVLSSLFEGAVGGVCWGALFGSVVGIAVGVLTGVVLLCAGVNRLDRYRAQTIGAATPAHAALLVASRGHGPWPIIIALAFISMAAPLGAWRAPHVLGDQEP
jgi:hypothetical protein